MLKAPLTKTFKLNSLCKSAFCSSQSIGNAIINYPAFRENTLTKIKAKYEKENLRQINEDKKTLDNEKAYIIQEKWSFHSTNEGKNSSIERIFNFSSNYRAQEFINYVKDKCDEIDHHPCWTISNHNNETLLKINLTSHFAGNNITNMDIHLAAYMTYHYINTLKSTPDRCKRLTISLVLNVIAGSFIFYIIKNKYDNWNKINMLNFNSHL